MTTVVVVDDQRLVRAGLISILRTQSDVDVVGEAANGRDAIRVVEEADPNVTLMDVPIEEFVRRPAPGSTKSDMLDPLTDRECEVLVDIARGRSNAEIASLLFLSEATIKTHVTRILTKLGLRDRTHAWSWPTSPGWYVTMLLSESDVLCRRLGIGDKPPCIAGRDGYRGFEELLKPFVALSRRQHGGAGDCRLDRSTCRSSLVHRSPQPHERVPAGDVGLRGELAASGVMKVSEERRAMVP